MISAHDGAFNRPAMADIGLNHLDLANIAERRHVISDLWLAYGDAYTIAALGEACYDRAPNKAGAAENSDQLWSVVNFVRFGLHPELLHESLIITPDMMPEFIIAACFLAVIYRLLATTQRGLVVTTATKAAFPVLNTQYRFEISRLTGKSRA
jgi:hypothetical protein